MGYVIKNIKKFVSDNAGVFLLMTISQMVCILLMLTSFGIYQNYLNESKNLKNGVNEAGELNEPVYFDLKTEPDTDFVGQSAVEMTDFYYRLGNIINDKTVGYGISCSDGIYLAFKCEDGVFKPLSERYDNSVLYDDWESGRYFTESEYANGKRVCVAPNQCREDYVYDTDEFDDEDSETLKPRYTAKKRGDKYYVTIFGIEYEVIGFYKTMCAYEIPITAVPKEVRIQEIPSMELIKPLVRSEYNEMLELYQEYFPWISSDEYRKIETYDIEEKYYYNTNMTITALISVVSAINLALIMRYILMKRRRTLAIFRITGCTLGRARRIYMTEILIILAAVFAVCLPLFDRLILNVLARFFPYITGAYSVKIYAVIFAVYMAVTYIVLRIMIMSYMRKTPIRLLKKNG